MNRRKFIGLSAVATTLAHRSLAEGPAAEKPILSFGLITDVQYADADPEGERHYRESPAKLQAAVKWLAGKNLPFTLHLGDFIDREFASYATVLPLLEPLGHPVRHLAGNHDYSVKPDEKEKVGQMLGMTKDHHSFEAAGLRFVMLDTNDVSVYKDAPDSPPNLAAKAMLAKLKAENRNCAQPWNGGLSVGQLEWLEKELAAADTAGQRVILCGHHPLLPAAGDQLWNGEDVLAVIDRHPCVAAYFNGHHHPGDEVMRNGVPYITFKSILQEPGVNAFSAIHWYADRFEIEGNGREKSRTIRLRAT